MAKPWLENVIYAMYAINAMYHMQCMKRNAIYVLTTMRDIDVKRVIEEQYCEGH